MAGGIGRGWLADLFMSIVHHKRIPKNLHSLRINHGEMTVLCELIDYAVECADAEVKCHIGGVSVDSQRHLKTAQARASRFHWLANQLGKVPPQ